MKLLIITQLLMMSFFFIYSTHPLTMGFLLISSTLWFSFMMNFTMKTFWFLYVLIIVFIGGMMVLFIYINSLFPNEKFNFNQTITTTILLISFFIFNILFLLNKQFNLLKINSQLNNLNLMNDTFFMTSMKIFSSSSSLIILALVNYLFFSFIIFVKITNFSSGPLRMIKYV
uniref:NADH dehydrogenase subunit 6 n=1 Tax=Archipsocus nomas TaxID=239250 RepID=A0A343QCF8_9NEOP|nr:NADH dehydrogenase subunit 6 [Archipsocus nomas]ATU07105.1 NADH dehydrogenase subunit 6 [Archipsocus nomas]